MGDPDVVGETVMTLHAFNIPLILASPRLADSVIQEGNILTTAPDMSSVVKVRIMPAPPAVLVKCIFMCVTYSIWDSEIRKRTAGVK
jgi:hypothetical protein